MQEETREYQKVISYLSQMIASGELAIGYRLPTERSLAETLSIGRNSTREALRMLEHTGVIVCKRGSGNYLTGNVSRPITEMVHMMLLLGQTDRKEICSFRRNMEKQSVGRFWIRAPFPAGRNRQPPCCKRHRNNSRWIGRSNWTGNFIFC